MTENVSSELREVERQVDNEFLKNALMSQPFAQAAWHFFAHFEDHFARQCVHAPDDELHYHALADNLINHSRWALKWLSSTCPPSNRKPPTYDDALYSHAMHLSELAMDYGPFTAAYSYFLAQKAFSWKSILRSRVSAGQTARERPTGNNRWAVKIRS